MRKWLVGTVGGLVLALGGLVGAAPAFAASGCLHDTCNGLDPTQSYNQNAGGQCSAGAYTALRGGASAVRALAALTRDSPLSG